MINLIKPKEEAVLLIIGGGQLGWMMIMFAMKLGIKFVVVDPNPNCSCAGIANVFVCAKLTDADAIVKAAKDNKCTHATIEIEHVNPDALKALEEMGLQVAVSSEALQTIQDKYLQKVALRDAGIPVPKFYNVPDYNKAEDLFGKIRSDKLVFKTRRDGYDGRGVVFPKNIDEVRALLEEPSKGYYVEECIDFIHEISVMVVRGFDGKHVVYPVAINKHIDGQLDETYVENCNNPITLLDKEVSRAAQETAVKVAKTLGVIGCCCVEMFIQQDGSILVNEVAPRPHNSYHFSNEGCITSQFENHILAVLGRTLGATDLLYPLVVMKNILGTNNDEAMMTGIEEALALGEGYLTIYNYMKHSRIARKGGHITYCVPNTTIIVERIDLIELLRQIIELLCQARDLIHF